MRKKREKEGAVERQIADSAVECQTADGRRARPCFPQKVHTHTHTFAFLWCIY